MTYFLLPIILLAFPGVGKTDQINHAKFVAQKAAMADLEGDDPFHLRESWWRGNMKPGDAKLIQQQLFSKNSYQFWLAVSDPDAEVFLNLYDSKGALVETETINYNEGSYVISMLVQPAATGIYYLRLALSKKSPTAQDWALIYAYK